MPKQTIRHSFAWLFTDAYLRQQLGASVPLRWDEDGQSVVGTNGSSLTRWVLEGDSVSAFDFYSDKLISTVIQSLEELARPFRREFARRLLVSKGYEDFDISWAPNDIAYVPWDDCKSAQIILAGNQVLQRWIPGGTSDVVLVSNLDFEMAYGPHSFDGEYIAVAMMQGALFTEVLPMIH